MPFPVISLTTAIVLFILFTLVIAYAGSKMARVADVLANVTGWGEAIVGAVLLGGVTSLPGIITSVTTAAENFPQISISNALGGIAAQTAFLAIADITHRKANLEHAAASLQNMVQATMLFLLLSLVLFTSYLPDVTVLGIHPITIVMLLIYVFGVKIISAVGENPMWRPLKTIETIEDRPSPWNEKDLNKKRLFLSFITLAAITGIAGFILGEAAIVIAVETGLSASLVGAIFTAIATSLPELITSVAAVRAGALTLAVSGIIGGNAFDVLFVAFSDMAYQQGSIYHQIGHDQVYIALLSLIMTSVLLIGLLGRQKSGIFKIGWESFLILIIFIGGYLLLFF